jgi:misacylated tRNA(Ala) deacylase
MKYLGIEKGKKNKTNLLFVAGDSVRQYLGHSYQVEKSLMGILK